MEMCIHYVLKCVLGSPYCEVCCVFGVILNHIVFAFQNNQFDLLLKIPGSYKGIKISQFMWQCFVSWFMAGFLSSFVCLSF